MAAGSINPVARPVTQVETVKPAVERAGERENDGDRDDKVGSATAKPTVNTNGQLIGSTISVKA
jgi:hypothetical protein